MSEYIVEKSSQNWSQHFRTRKKTHPKIGPNILEAEKKSQIWSQYFRRKKKSSKLGHGELEKLVPN